jgi:hypothetical protein
MPPSPTSTRPQRVTILLWAVFLYGVWNVGRAVALGRQLSVLAGWGAQPDPRLRLAFALIWIILFWAAAVALWRRRPFTRRAIPLLLLIVTVYELSLNGVFAQSPLARHNLALNAGFYAATILYSVWALGSAATIPYWGQPDKEEGA